MWSEQSAFQINWCQMSEPKEERMTKNMERLFPMTDFVGQVDMVYDR